MRIRHLGNRRLLVPEVVQTSAMDCGPASLKCLLEGFGIHVSYGRLREACQTDVDGTSIDTMEEVAVQLGLVAEQIMVPPDYILARKTAALPAIAVVTLANGITHFVVAWHRHGRFVQIMDPATGRQWPSVEHFLGSLYLHTVCVPLATWRDWAGSEKFLSPLESKLIDLELARTDADRLIKSGVADPGWHSLAALEAATRTAEAMVASKGVSRGAEASRVLDRLFQRAAEEVKTQSESDRKRGEAEKNTSEPKPQRQIIPPDYWSVRPAPSDDDGGEQVFFRGAVLVHAISVRTAPIHTAFAPTNPQTRPDPTNGQSREHAPAESLDQNTTHPPLPRELVAALEEPAVHAGREFWRLLRADGLLSPIGVTCALFLAAAGVMVEVLLFRSLLDMAQLFGVSGQRLGVMGLLLAFVGALLLLEFPIASATLRMGRRLEAHLRIAFLEKIPRLGDRYFHSRLNSDMAERSHSMHRIRLLPQLGGELLRSTFELILTAVGIIWLDPASAPLAILAAALALLVPLAVQPVLAERDMRLRNHSGALSRFYLDALRGIIPLHTHSAERSLRKEHESLLGEWTLAGLGLQSLVVWVEAVQFLIGFGLAAWLLLNYTARVGESGSVLLLVYWALNLPVLGQDIAQVAWRYPTLRNTILRLLEPLGAREEIAAESVPDVNSASPRDSSREPEPIYAVPSARGVAIKFEDVSVRVSGHIILEQLGLTIDAGSHVAVVGPSGAGKSSFLGLLLGWYPPANGRVLIEDAPLGSGRLNQLRREIAWVDPAVQLWNQSLLENLRYGASADTIPDADVLDAAELRDLLSKLPEGFQTQLGESGALVSGGEGQRVRLARAILKPGVRLALLDEPFRGLARQQRRKLLSQARQHWQDATMICVTHDVGDTLSFPRVLVIEAGRIVEDGKPLDLAARENSRYRSLLEAEEKVREGLWSSATWRHLTLEGGHLAVHAGKARA